MKAACAAAAAVAVAALVSAGIALAAPPLRMSAADRKAIGNVVDRFVKDAVLRRDLAAAWKLAGPDIRGGTTYKAWVAGTGVTVPYFPVRGNDFRNAWTGTLVGPGHAALSIIMNPAPGARGYEETAMTVDVRKIRGRWLVDLFYSTAVFHKSGGVSGPNDFGASAGGTPLGNSKSRIAGHWLLFALAGVIAIVVLLPLGIWLRVKRRDRRAWAAYVQSRAGGSVRR